MTDMSELWRAEMMSVEDIAAMWKVDRALRTETSSPSSEGFPAPAPGSTRKFQRWLRSQVEAFAQGISE
jgi:hypothetical protein